MSEGALHAFPEKIALGKKYADASVRDNIALENNGQIQAWETLAQNDDEGFAGKWNDPRADITLWNDINLPGDFSEAGIKDFCGVIWIARDIEIPAILAEVESSLWLGTIVDSDTVFINGIQVGTTGYRYPPRKYGIAKGVLKPGKNRVTIRIVCRAGEGGVTRDKPFRVFSDKTAVELAGTWKYRIGMTAGIRPKEFFFQWQPMGNFNAMIAPVLKYQLKGILWYQGESNDNDPYNYEALLTAMINDWRGKYGNTCLPFIAVQLPEWGIAEDNNLNSSWAVLREAQAAIQKLPNTAIAAALDTGEWNDLHPLNKKDAGYRLFLAADKLLNGADNSSPGPAARGYKIENGKLVITFNNCARGLTSEETVYVSIGTGGGFKRLPARITGTDSIVIDITDVEKPRIVLYAYAKNPKDRQLYNSDKLPAMPFRLNIPDE
jgi:sialate O-acetylesterase